MKLLALAVLSIIFAYFAQAETIKTPDPVELLLQTTGTIQNQALPDA